MGYLYAADHLVETMFTYFAFLVMEEFNVKIQTLLSINTSAVLNVVKHKTNLQ